MYISGRQCGVTFKPNGWHNRLPLLGQLCPSLMRKKKKPRAKLGIPFRLGAHSTSATSFARIVVKAATSIKIDAWTRDGSTIVGGGASHM